jgi:hypothetical protein
MNSFPSDAARFTFAAIAESGLPTHDVRRLAANLSVSSVSMTKIDQTSPERRESDA